MNRDDGSWQTIPRTQCSTVREEGGYSPVGPAFPRRKFPVCLHLNPILHSVISTPQKMIFIYIHTYFLLSCFQTIKLDLLFTPHSSIYCKLSKDDDVVVFIINYCLVPHLVFLNTSPKIIIIIKRIDISEQQSFYLMSIHKFLANFHFYKISFIRHV